MNESCQVYYNKLIEFKERLAAESFQAAYWISFLDMVEVLLNIILASRVGNFDLYIATLQEILPWTFAYDFCLDILAFITKSC